MLHGARAEDGGGDDGIGDHPGEGELGGGAGLASGEGLHFQRHVEALRPQLRLLDAPVPAGGAGAFREGLSSSILAGEDAARQGTVSHDADAELLAEGKELQFRVAVDDVIKRLNAAQGRQVVAVARPQGFADLPGVEIGAADVAHLSLADEEVESLRIGPVDEIEVDVVGVQTAQAVVHLGEDVVATGARVVGAVSHGAAHLGDEHGLAAAVGKGFADDAL